MEPALDLPLALALASSTRDRPIRPGTVAVGEIGLLGELRARHRARASPARGGPARVRRGRSSRAGGPRTARSAVDGIELVAGRERSSGDRARAQRRSALLVASRLPGDARLTVRPDRMDAGLAGRVPRRSLIRFIRVSGAALGGVVGLVLATTGGGLFHGRLRRRVARRLGRGVARRRLRDPAVPHGGPGRAGSSARSRQLSTAEFVAAVVGLLIGLLMGLLLGFPLSGLAGAVGVAGCRWASRSSSASGCSG